MLNKKQIAVLFIISLIPFSLFLFIDKPINGADSYFGLGKICRTIFMPESEDVLFNFALQFIPCNIFIIKLLLFALLFVSVLIVAFWGSLFNKEKGWMAGLFVLFCPRFVYEFTKFENDQFAFPILFLAGYFFLLSKIKKENRVRNALFGLVLTCFAAGFWQGAVFWLIGFGLTSLITLLPAIAMIYLNFNRLIEHLLPQSNVFEYHFGYGLGMLWILGIGLLGIKGILWPPTLFFFALLLLRMKYTILIAPFLAVGMVLFLQKLDKLKGKENKLLSFRIKGERFAQSVKNILAYLFVISILLWSVWLVDQPPTRNDLEAVAFAVDIAEGDKIKNAFDFGWWIKYMGGDTDYFMSPPSKAYDFNGIAMSWNFQQSFQLLDCNILKEFDRIIVYKC